MRRITRLLMAMQAAYGSYIAPPAFVVSVSAASAAEGANLVHTVTLSGPVVGAPIAYAFVLTDGTATSGVDYGSPSFNNGVTLSVGYATVPIGFSSFQVTIPALTDALDAESSENYTLSVGGISAGGSIINVVALGTLAYGASPDAGQVDTPWTAPPWSAIVDYKPSDMVADGGAKFWAIKAVPAGTATSNTTYWQPIVATYFIDAVGGLDTYNGLSQYAGYLTNTDGTQGSANAAYGPWQTLAAVQEKTYVGYWDTAAKNDNTFPKQHDPWTAALSGSVFLFKRGTAYAGQIQVHPGYPTIHGDFLFGAYGTGARPQINHDAMATRFSLDRGIFWVNTSINNVKVRNMAFDGLYGVSDPGNVLHPKKTAADIGGSYFAFVNSSMTRTGGDGIKLLDSVATYGYIKNGSVSYCGLGGHPGNGIGGGATGGLVENMTVSYCGASVTHSHGIYITNWNEFTVRRCDISYSSNFGINSGAYGNNPLIEENYIHDNLNGIDLGSSNYELDEFYTGTVRVIGNIIANNGVTDNGHAIYTVNFCTDALIANNLIYGNRGDGITVHRPTNIGVFAQRPTSNVKIHNNTIHSAYATRCVRFLDPVTASSVRNNIMMGTHSGVDGVMQDTNMVLSELTLTNNLYYFPNKANPQNVVNRLGVQTTLATMQGLGYESGSATGDPLFTNVGANDYTLQGGSPAKLTGYASGITLDLVRSARNAITPTIGAYE